MPRFNPIRDNVYLGNMLTVRVTYSGIDLSKYVQEHTKLFSSYTIPLKMLREYIITGKYVDPNPEKGARAKLFTSTVHNKPRNLGIGIADYFNKQRSDKQWAKPAEGTIEWRGRNAGQTNWTGDDNKALMFSGGLAHVATFGEISRLGAGGVPNLNRDTRFKSLSSIGRRVATRSGRRTVVNNGAALESSVDITKNTLRFRLSADTNNARGALWALRYGGSNIPTRNYWWIGMRHIDDMRAILREYYFTRMVENMSASKIREKVISSDKFAYALKNIRPELYPRREEK